MKQNLNRKVCGEFPEFCYKVYDCEDYAKQLINNGIFRLYCRCYYQNIEDLSRCDSTEGFGHTSEPGIYPVGLVSPNPNEKTIWAKEYGYQEHHVEYGNKTYYFCTSLPDANFDYIKERFGKYIVKIDNPKKLAEDINEYLINLGKKYLIQGCKVVYNKGQKLEKKLTDNERLDLAYTQKPKSYSSECEFRFVALGLEKPCEQECEHFDGQSERTELMCAYIEVNLGRQLSYMNLLNSQNIPIGDMA